MATEHSGNTIPSCVSKARMYQITLNEVDKWDDLLDYLWYNRKQSQRDASYLIACAEKAPTTGHEHIHCFIHFGTPVALSVKKCCGAHIEKCRGSVKQNIDYIRKDGNIIEELGEEPHQGYASTIRDLKTLNEDDVMPMFYNVYKKVKAEDNAKQNFFQMLNEIREDKLQKPEVIYIKGPSGKGKTYAALKYATQHYQNEDIAVLTLNNNFGCITGADNAKCIVIPEFRDSQISASEFLQLIDAYGHNLNVKGGFVNLRPKTWIICSIIEPNMLYTKAKEVNKQFLRRITKLLELGENYTVSEISISTFYSEPKWDQGTIDLEEDIENAMEH